MTDTDYEAAYRDLQLRVTDLLRDRDDDTIEQTVPATPKWRVRDVVAHLGGVCDDIAHGDLSGVGTDAWTAAQVDKRRDWPFAQVIDDWAKHAATIAPTLNDIGTPMGQLLFDAWTHEQDLRGALGEPGGLDDAALDIAFTWFVTQSQQAANFPTAIPDRGSLRVETPEGSFFIGAGEPRCTVRTSRAELLRAITGRRSVAQLRALDCDGEPLDAVLFPNPMFRPASRDLVE